MKGRGPLSGANPSQLQALRALVTAYRDWERRAGTPAQTLRPRVPAAGRHLSLPIAVEETLAARTDARLARRPDAAAIAARQDELRAHTPATGAVAIILAGIHEELLRIRVILERRAAHGDENREDVP